MVGYAQNGPQGPPPSYDASQSHYHHGFAGSGNAAPPPYHNWQEVVPDTSTFPPPPLTGNMFSNTGNASTDDSDRALEFCNRNPLYIPVQPSAVVYKTVQNHDVRLLPPNEFRGSLSRDQQHWKGSSRDRNGDCLLSTNLPLYFAMFDSPFHTEISKTIYFEVKLLRLRAGPTASDSSGLAIGFVAHPYPLWRSPGWERASLGVFSDDGCRFVNDAWGGKDFTRAFKEGETVGLGMNFHLPEDINVTVLGQGSRKLKVDVFFTRNGQNMSGWDLHEEVDEEAGGVGGLEGDFDLYAAVGLFGGVDFEACFDPTGWLWKPQLGAQ